MGGFSPERQSLVVIGNFDGVHLGHRAVLTEASLVAKARDLDLKVLTFDPHPALVLGRGAPEALTRTSRKVELLVAVAPGLDVVVHPFNDQVAALSPEEFAVQILRQKLGASVVLVGENFRFGRGRTGDFAALMQLGRRLGFEARALPLVGDQQGSFSSTRIRGLLSEGRVAEAQEFLSRPHRLTGVVKRGDQRGSSLGFPTANLGEIAELLPADGVYAVRVFDGSSRFLGDGALNVGSRPTVERPHSVEVHVLDPSDALPRDDWYGLTLSVDLIQRIRAVEKFESVDALRRQIDRDLAEVRSVLGPVGQHHGT